MDLSCDLSYGAPLLYFRVNVYYPIVAFADAVSQRQGIVWECISLDGLFVNYSLCPEMLIISKKTRGAFGILNSSPCSEPGPSFTLHPVLGRSRLLLTRQAGKLHLTKLKSNNDRHLVSFKSRGSLGTSGVLGCQRSV
jgi:hypothetical protein